jgi:O-antigen ligase
VFAIGVAGGGYGPDARAIAAVAVWLGVLGLIGLSPRRSMPVGRRVLLTGGLLTAFAVFTGLSALWADSAERAVAELGRVTLYVGVFVLAALAVRGRGIRGLADGLAIGIAGIAVLALIGRYFPSALPDERVGRLLPGEVRLSYPIGYWNGLGMLTALALPLLVSAAAADRPRWARGLAVAPLPALATVVYLTSSRGAVIVALVGLIALLALSARRVAVLLAALIGLAGGAAGILIAHARPELIDSSLHSAKAFSQGRDAALLTLLACVVTGLLGMALPRPCASQMRMTRGVRVAAVALVLVLIGGGALAADPVRRFDDFKRSPARFEHVSNGYVDAHLSNAGATGRWQFWTAAVDEWRTEPLAGRGAGTYQAWWAQHGQLAFFVRNAHSLYLETLGDLGVVGLVLLLAAFAAGVAAGARHLGRRDARERERLAALLAAFIAFAVGAAIDWIWQLPVIGIVAMCCLGALAGSGGDAVPAPVRARGRRAPLLAALGVLGACAVLAAQILPWLSVRELRSSYGAVRRGDLRAAIADAGHARALAPWSSSPYTQLALLAERAGDLADGRRLIAQAIDRDQTDWTLHVAAARLAVKAQDVPAGRAELRTARKLNPHAPGLGGS